MFYIVKKANNIVIPLNLVNSTCWKDNSIYIKNIFKTLSGKDKCLQQHLKVINE